MRLTEAWLQQVISDEDGDAELVLLEEAGSRRRRIIRLYVDHPGGVTHDLCARVSTAVGRALDEADAFDGPYTLEVSSPGLERPLRKPVHFEAQVGKKVYVKTRVPVEGSKVWQGTLREVDGETVVIEEAGRTARIPLGEIDSAHVIFEL